MSKHEVVRIRDINSCPPSGRFYGGCAGRKLGILVDGEPWIAKYPRPGRELTGHHARRHPTSPVAEWLGSHIYQACGIPAHETMLAWHGGQVVCACKDFTGNDLRLIEFEKFKTTLSDELEGFGSSPSDGSVTFLSDVLATIQLVPALASDPAVLARFWDMFVVDALIKNPDRNNGNWGMLSGAGGLSLAPVYDNGSSLFSKRSASLTDARLDDQRSEREDAFGTNVSCYRLMCDDEPAGRAIHPFAYMMESENPDLAAAVERARASVDLAAIGELIDAVPSEAYGRSLMTTPQRKAHKRLIGLRYHEGIVAASERFRRLGLA